MKKRALTTAISFLIMTLSSTIGQNALIEVTTFGSNPGDLQMFKYIPEKTPQAPPMVVVLHGCAQSAEDIARLTGWNRLADRHEFVLLYPQQKMTNNIQRCFNWFVPEDIEKGRGENQSIKEMIDRMIRDHSVDSSKIFITGMSAGGAMTAVMMATYPDKLQAGGIMSGVPYGGAVNLTDAVALMGGSIQKNGLEWAELVKDQNPEFKGSFPRLILFQGADDPIVRAPNADELIKQWAALHELSESPAEQKTLEELPAVQYTRWKKEGKEVIVRYDIQGLGHAIAIDPGEGPKQGGQKDTFAKDVDFHSTFWIAKFFEVVK